MHFFKRSIHFSKTCCRPLITSKFLASELHFHGWKRSEIAWGEIWTVVDVVRGLHRSTFSKPKTEFDSHQAPMRFLGFSNREMELQGKKFRSDQRSAARFREMGGAL
jgi:hypothetical protein